VLFAVAAFCLLVQMLSATLQERSLETPNAATWLAQSLARDGQFAYGELRALQLPGESLYLAGGFMVLPQQLWPYLHVPVVVVLVTAIAAIALIVGGPRLAVAVAAVASLDPYIVRHGPVWDDTLLAAALEWSLLAMLIALVAKGPSAAKRARALLPLVVCVAALAAITRTLSQLVLIGVALMVMAHPRLRPGRATGLAILLGVALALGAWGTRNVLVLGSFHLGSSHDGEVLFKSNCGYTREGIRQQGVVGTFMHDCSPAQAAHALTLPELEYDRQLRQYALAYMAANPIETAKTAAFKVVVSLSGYNFAAPPLSFRNVVAVTSSLLTLSLGLHGLWMLLRRTSASPPLSLLAYACLIVGAFTLVMLAVGPTGMRYRIGFNGFLYLGVGVILTAKLPQLRRHGLSFPARIIGAVRN
jgi:hypothetical protein